MKELNIASPEEYFLEISSLKKHPDFTKIETIIPDQGSIETTSIKRGNAYQHTKTGFREDLGLTLRSNWEANFARILNAYKIKFDFEPTVFAFPIKKRN
jgi:hypothetical protein